MYNEEKNKILCTLPREGVEVRTVRFEKYGNSIITRSGDIDWFKYLPFKMRFKIFWSMLFGRKIHTKESIRKMKAQRLVSNTQSYTRNKI
jgi:hypothetical protein